MDRIKMISQLENANLGDVLTCLEKRRLPEWTNLIQTLEDGFVLIFVHCNNLFPNFNMPMLAPSFSSTMTPLLKSAYLYFTRSDEMAEKQPSLFEKWNRYIKSHHYQVFTSLDNQPAIIYKVDLSLLCNRLKGFPTASGVDEKLKQL